MEQPQIDMLIQQAVEPYLQMIEQLQSKQKEKEAEIVVLKYALLEMDRKFTELEKKLKTPATANRVGMNRTTTAGSRPSVQGRTVGGTSSNMTTPRGTSRTGTTVQNPRERSKTPVAGQRVQNQLNSSMISKRSNNTAVGGNSRTRVDSKSRQDMQSSSLRQGSQTTRNTKEEAKKSLNSTGVVSTRNASRNTGVGLERGHSRNSSRTGKDLQSSVGKKNSTMTQKELQSLINQNGGTSTSRGDPLNNSHSAMLLDNPNLIQANFGKIQSIIYPWEKKPLRDDPSIRPGPDTLKLAYVPSYNGRNARNNIEFLDHQNIIFFSSTIVVIMNIDTYEQQLLQGHTDEIQCMAYSKDAKLLVTAQKANSKDKDAFFILWDLQTQRRVCSIAYHQKLISQVAIDDEGLNLVTVGGTDRVSVAVWSIKDLTEQARKAQTHSVLKTIQPICEYQLGQKVVINTLYVDPAHSTLTLVDIVMGAEKGVRFFTAKMSESIIEEKKATFSQGQDSTLKNVYGIAFQGDDIYASGDNGYIYVFREDKVTDSKFKAESICVQCVSFIEREGQQVMITMGEDFKLSMFDQQRQLIRQIDLIDDGIKSRLGMEHFNLKPKAHAHKDGVLIVGFEQNVILKFNLDTNQKDILIAGPAAQTQYIVSHPTLKVFASVGIDKFLRLYNYEVIGTKTRNCLINTIELQNQAKCCDFSPNGKYFVVGYENGVFEVFQVYDNNGEFFQLECLRLFDLNRKYAIQCVRFSPDGKYLVISCFKDLVVFSAESEDFDQEGLLKGNTTTVTQLQFDKNSHYAMTNSIDGQVLVWEMAPGFQRVDPSKVKDLEWDRKSAIFAFDTIGIWSPEMKETDVNQVSISTDKHLMAVADSTGRVRVFTYPAYLPKQNCLTLETGHANNVISSVFMRDDSYLVTAGELDCSIMIWAYKAGSSDNSSKSSPLNINLNQIKDAHIVDELEREMNIKKDTDENLLD